MTTSPAAPRAFAEKHGGAPHSKASLRLWLRLLSCSMIDRVEGDRVILDQPAAEAKQRIQEDGHDRGFFRDSEDREDGRILNRAFSGTYER